MLPDRHFAVPPGHIVRTAYVDVFGVRIACRERMAVGDVAEAFQKLLRAGCDQPFPCPNGHWEHRTFVIDDGRHEWLASIMLGKTHILVAWLDSGPATAEFSNIVRKHLL